MKIVRFTAKSYSMGRIVEAGEVVMVPDDFPLAPHIVDVAAESAPAEAVPEPEPVDQSDTAPASPPAPVAPPVEPVAPAAAPSPPAAPAPTSQGSSIP